MNQKIVAILKYLDNYLEKTGQECLNPVEANELLEEAGLFKDSVYRPGKPLRDLLRKGALPYAYQTGGKGSSWIIPHSGKKSSTIVKENAENENKKNAHQIDAEELKNNIEKARLKYKPDDAKYLLVAEAPPNSIDRFFYYEDVNKYDYLFLGVAEAIYPKLKNKYLLSRRNRETKKEILNKLKEEGFYLLDLSELPLSLTTNKLSSQLPTLCKKIETILNINTKIILIKANVYDIAYSYLQEKFRNVVDIRIPFPGQGNQRKFQILFNEALKLVQYK